MKKLKRIVKFTVETERTLIFRSRGNRRVAWCERCGAEVEMATVDEAARGGGRERVDDLPRPRGLLAAFHGDGGRTNLHLSRLATDRDMETEALNAEGEP